MWGRHVPFRGTLERKKIGFGDKGERLGELGAPERKTEKKGQCGQERKKKNSSGGKEIRPRG